MKVGDNKVTKHGVQMIVKCYVKGAQQPFILVDPKGQLFHYNRDGTFVGKHFPSEYDLINSSTPALGEAHG